MDIGKAFSYFTEDKDWIKKVLIGGLINIVPIVNFASTGYGLVQTKKVFDGNDLPLPEWDNFGAYFMKGLMAFVGQIVYGVPVIVLYCCAFILPTVVLTAGANGRSGEPGPLAALSGPLFFCGICLIVLYVLALLVFIPALFIRYALTDQFGVFFQIGPAWKLINSNLGSYFTAVLLFVVAFMVAGFVGGLLCGLGTPFGIFWASLVGAYLFGNFAKSAPQAAMATA
jgi:hypothetical protein